MTRTHLTHQELTVPKHVPVPSLSEQITEHMRTQPRGRFRPTEIADALPSRGMDTPRWRQRVANEMARMGRNGTLLRGRVTGKQMGPGVYYWIPTGKQAPKPKHKAASVVVTCSCGRELPSMQAFREHQGKYKP